MALLQEGARRFDLYSKDIRRAIGELGIQTLELIQQHKPIERMYAVKGEDGALVEKTILLPQEVSLRQHLKVVATSASSSSNKEIMRQNALTAFGLLVQYLNKLFELGAVMVSPTMPEPMKKLAYDMSQTGEKLMQRVLEGFDLEDIANMLPQLEGLLNVTAQGAPAGDPSGQGVGSNGGGSVGSEDGVPNITALTSGGSRRTAGGG